jgi:hypothetical protein
MRIPWLSFARWSSRSGALFIAERVYVRGRRTPLVLLTRRYPWRSIWNGTWPESLTWTQVPPEALSPADSVRFAQSLINPPPPNEALRRAVQRRNALLVTREHYAAPLARSAAAPYGGGVGEHEAEGERDAERPEEPEEGARG